MKKSVVILVSCPLLRSNLLEVCSFDDLLFAFIGLGGASVLAVLSVVFSDDSFFVGGVFGGLLGLVTFGVTLFQIENTHFQVYRKWHFDR